MAENLRNHLIDPTLNQDIIQRADIQGLAGREAVLDNMLARPIERNLVTRNSPTHAYEVAHAIKPEIDKLAELQDRIDNPKAQAARVIKDGRPTDSFVGVEDTKQLKVLQKATKVDLERNAEKATRLSVQRDLGKLAVEK